MKKLFFALLYSLGVHRFTRWWNRRRVIILCYHGVTERDTRSLDDPKGLHVNHRRFAAHLDYLQHHYRVISLHQYLEARHEGRSTPHYAVVLTFDDGFRNFLTAGAQQLAAYGMPATMFLITDQTTEETPQNNNGNWAPIDDRTYLSWPEVQRLERENRIEFGSHTCSHPNLSSLPPKEIERELHESYNAMVAHLNHQTPSLAYPRGEYSKLISNQARKAGYSCAVTTDRGANHKDQDLFALGRTLIGDDDDEASFAVRVSGLRQWLVDLRMIFKWRVEWGELTPDVSLSNKRPSKYL